ncbi:B3 DNA binding domain-containing protein, partial [Tanacetum coccineum]
SSAIERANEIQASLPSELPSFVKLMLPSHVTRCFWLGLPKSFCDAHLPKDDVTVVLVGEGDQEYNTKYLDRKTGLSGGWRGFSMAHKLLAGDVLVFQLIEQWKMKVYIVRTSGLNEIDGARGLLNLVPCDMNGYIVCLKIAGDFQSFARALAIFLPVWDTSQPKSKSP